MKKYSLIMDRDLEARAVQIGIINAARTMGRIEHLIHEGELSEVVFRTADAEFARRIGARRVS